MTRFLYSGSEIIAEYNGAGALQSRYVRGASADEVLVEYQGGAPLTNKRWLIADERGSIIGAANSSGASQYKNAYDEYGRPSPTNTGRFQYTGQLWLYELNLYHYKARAYSPNLARFLQTDPIGYADGLNLYAYVGGDPVNANDPSGLLERGFSLLGGSCARECVESIASGIDDEVVSEGTRSSCLACRNPAPGLLPGGFPREFGGEQLGGERGASGGRSVAYQVDCNGPGGCITVSAIRNSTSSLTLGPSPFVSFQPGDFCYQNPYCSGRVEAVYYDIDAILTFAGVRAMQIGARASLPAIGGYLGPAGPIFGDTAFGAAKQGIFNSGFYRLGFGRGGGVANFRFGVGNEFKLYLFNVPIPPAGG